MAPPRSATTPSHPRAPRWSWRSLATGLTGLAIIVGGFALGPALTHAGGANLEQVIAASVSDIRAMLAYHRHSALLRTNESGWPMSISPAWFAGQAMPKHPLTNLPFHVEAVDDDPSSLAPLEKRFDPADRRARTLWYNRTNGAVCVRVPRGASDAETLASFNTMNALALTRLDARCESGH